MIHRRLKPSDSKMIPRTSTLWPRAFLAVLTSGILLWSPWTPIASAQEGTAPSGESVLVTVEGRVEVSPSGSLKWSAGVPEQKLAVGDRVRTGLKSRATLQLSDLSVLRLNQLTVLEIKAPQAEGEKSNIGIQGGSTYFFNRDRPGSTGFQTPSASGAIRGTEFHLAVDDEGTTRVTLLDGEVQLANAAGSTTLVSGEEGTARTGEAPSTDRMGTAGLRAGLEPPAAADEFDLLLVRPYRPVAL